MIFGENGFTRGKHSLKFGPHHKNIYHCNRPEQKRHTCKKRNKNNKGGNLLFAFWHSSQVKIYCAIRLAFVKKYHQLVYRHNAENEK